MSIQTYDIDSGVVTVPAGTYVIGDPTYAVPDERWAEWLEAADYRDTDGPLAAPLDGHLIVGVRTHGGDGTYEGSDGASYPVDSGLIGLVPEAIARWNLDGQPNLVTFDQPVECFYEGGVIHLGDVEIDTDPTEETCCDRCGVEIDGGWDLCDRCEALDDEEDDEA